MEIKVLILFNRVGDDRNKLLVCVVGYPNVGKSSLINCLLLLKSHRNIKGHKRLSSISGQVGSTKKSESYKIDKYIEIYDTPGIIFNDNDRVSIYIDIYKNLKDPIELFSKLFPLLSVNELDYIKYLSNFATSRGKLNKNGTPDLNGAAIIFFDSLNKGYIQYYNTPLDLKLRLLENKKVERNVHEREFKYVKEELPQSKLGILNKMRKKQAKKNKKRYT